MSEAPGERQPPLDARAVQLQHKVEHLQGVVAAALGKGGGEAGKQAPRAGHWCPSDGGGGGEKARQRARQATFQAAAPPGAAAPLLALRCPQASSARRS